eukprot:TRINITY_DN4423_c0_g1_i6.p2 TRINITY_DN4423_c0_g1~~TRINITY_DN4423_c0_g1_i6.p2  ORF type:complete len:211 (+),score=-2.57 TRINITY_DN4423_c0_g1_i6:1546-2178(+)
MSKDTISYQLLYLLHSSWQYICTKRDVICFRENPDCYCSIRSHDIVQKVVLYDMFQENVTPYILVFLQPQFVSSLYFYQIISISNVLMLLRIFYGKLFGQIMLQAMMHLFFDELFGVFILGIFVRDVEFNNFNKQDASYKDTFVLIQIYESKQVAECYIFYQVRLLYIHELQICRMYWCQNIYDRFVYICQVYIMGGYQDALLFSFLQRC